MHHMTPAGKQREDLTRTLLDHHDQDHVCDVLEDMIPSETLRRERYVMRSNGGGSLTNRDLCALLSVYDLEKACEELGI